MPQTAAQSISYRALRQPPMLVGWTAALLATTVLIASLVGPAQPGWQLRGTALVAIPLALTTTWLALRVAEFCDGEDDDRLRRGWWLLAIGLLLLTMGNMGTVARELGLAIPAPAGVLLEVAAYLTLLVAFRTIPDSRHSRVERPIFWLDTLIMLVGASLLLWQVRMSAVAGAGYARPTDALSPANLLADLLLFTTAATAARVTRRPATRKALALLALAILVQGLSEMGALFTPGNAYTRWAAASWLGSRILILLAVQIELASRIDDRAARSTQPKPSGTFCELSGWNMERRFLPLLGLLLGDGLLVVVAITNWPSELSMLGLGAVALTALVVARQIAMERVSRHTESRFRSLVQHSSDIITIVDGSFRMTYVSPAAAQVFGVSPEEVLGTPLSDHLHPEDLATVRPILQDVALRRGTSAKVAYRIRRAEGGWCHTETVATNQFGVESIGGLVLNTRDVSERMQLEARLTHQAYHDPLTGLANRVLFRQRVALALQRADHRPSSVAVLFVDLDDFKRVNDSLGHAEGDRLLVNVAARLLNATRGCDTVARLGGDEFAILLQNVREPMDMVTVAERVLGAVRLPVPLSGREVTVGLSVGIARATSDDSTDDLLRNADVAMYISKKQGKGRYQIFRPEMHAEVVERLELEADMRKTLGGSDFGVCFQPIVALGDARVTGLEALVRWNHPVRGNIPPSTFVQLAEETGLIVPLGHWVLQEACRHAAIWQREAQPGTPPISITVNLSSRQLHETGLVNEVASVLRATRLEPSSLVLEVTESVMMQDTEVTLGRLRELKALGVQLAIDDFGTGYSSLAYLQRYPIDVMKIDRTFVDGVAHSTSDLALVRAILSLADSLGLSTVAEGIEEEAQRAALLRLGCELGQGYLFARPMAPEEIGTLLRRGATEGQLRQSRTPRLSLATGS